MTTSAELADDLLIGAPAIAAHLYGDAAHYRRIYALKKSNRLPVFRMGRDLVARRSTLALWIRRQEERAAAGFDE